MYRIEIDVPLPYIPSEDSEYSEGDLVPFILWYDNISVGYYNTKLELLDEIECMTEEIRRDVIAHHIGVREARSFLRSMNKIFDILERK